MSRSATQRRTKMCGLRMLGLGGQRFLALMALMSPPMSLTRNTDLAQRTVTLFGGAREGETVSFGVFTAVPPVRPVPESSSDGFALVHCDAAAAPIARDRCAPVVPMLCNQVFLLIPVAVPLNLFLGRHDLNVNAEVAAAWFDAVKAPEKRLVWFEHSAHMPMTEEPGKSWSKLAYAFTPFGFEIPCSALVAELLCLQARSPRDTIPTNRFWRFSTGKRCTCWSLMLFAAAFVV
jgi:pimeloyl-ACP methyl ester carboxylesterase